MPLPEQFRNGLDRFSDFFRRDGSQENLIDVNEFRVQERIFRKCIILFGIERDAGPGIKRGRRSRRRAFRMGG